MRLSSRAPSPVHLSVCSSIGTRRWRVTGCPMPAPWLISRACCSSWMKRRLTWRSCSTSAGSNSTSSCSCVSSSSTPWRCVLHASCAQEDKRHFVCAFCVYVLRAFLFRFGGIRVEPGVLIERRCLNRWMLRFSLLIVHIGQ